MLNRLFGNYLCDKKMIALEQLDGLLPVSQNIKAEIEKIEYIRMTDARLRYEDYFESLTTKNNQPLSARTWFTEAYKDYLPPVNENGIWYNIKGQKCKGEVIFE